MDKQKWINKKTELLITKEGYKPDQAYAIAHSLYAQHHKQEGGQITTEQLGNLNLTQNAIFPPQNIPMTFEQQQKTIAPQLPVSRILYGVQTNEPKQGLPEGNYTRVDYNNGTSDYLTQAGLENFKRMNNYRLFMEQQAKNQQSMQQGGSYNANPMSPYGHEIIKPIKLVEKATDAQGNEGYNVYYDDPKKPEADKVFFTNSEYAIKKDLKQPTSMSPANYEPYLQAYLRQTQGRTGIPTMQGGGWYDQNQPMFTANQPAYIPPITNGANMQGSLGYPSPQFQKVNSEDINLSIDNQSAPSGLSQQQYASTLQGAMTTPYGENLRQNTEQGTVGQTTTDETKKPLSQAEWQRVQLLNPYGGGLDLETSLALTGKYAGEGNAGMAAVAGGLSLLKGVRTGLGAYAGAKASKEAYQDYLKQFKEEPAYTNISDTPMQNFQQGGITNAQALTGNYLTESENPNVNIEQGEQVLNAQSGEIQKAVGDKHKDGGIDTTLPEGSQVLSDYTKIGAKNAKDFREDFEINVKATDTFAKVLDKVNAKIGWTKIIKEEEDLIKSIEKMQIKTKDENTKNINLEFLQEKYQKLLGKKDLLQAEQKKAFNEIFEEQEAIPKKSDGNTILDDGGKPISDEEILANKYNTTPERVKEIMQEGGMTEQAPQQESNGQQDQMLQQIAGMLQQGTSPDDVITMLIQQNIPHQQAMGIVEAVMQQLQGQQLPVAQEGIRIGSKYEDPNLYKKQSATDEGWNTFGELLAKNPQEVLTEIKRVHPELYQKYFKGDKVDKNNIAEFQHAVNKKYQGILKDAETVYGADSPKVQQLQQAIEADKFIEDVSNNKNIRATDAMLGNYTSTRPNFMLEVLPTEDLKKVNEAGVNTASQLKEKFPDLYKTYVGDKKLSSDFWLGDIKKSNPETPKDTTLPPAPEKAQVQGQTQPITKYAVPLLPQDYIMPPSALQPVAKQDISLGRVEPVKQTAEPLLAQQAQQALAIQQQNFQNLTPEAAASANAMLGATQMQAVNQALGQVEASNQGAIYNAELANMQQSDKEKLLQAGVNEKYQERMYAAMNNTERDWRRYFNQMNAQNKQNYMDVQNLQLVNALTPDYQFTGQNIEFSNRPIVSAQQQADLEYAKKMQAYYKSLTPEQQAQFQKQQNA